MELCPVCGAYWECDCPKDEPIIGVDEFRSRLTRELGREFLGNLTLDEGRERLTVKTLREVRDEYRERYGGG